jgi:hypothetical protein
MSGWFTLAVMSLRAIRGFPLSQRISAQFVPGARPRLGCSGTVRGDRTTRPSAQSDRLGASLCNERSSRSTYSRRLSNSAYSARSLSTLMSFKAPLHSLKQNILPPRNAVSFSKFLRRSQSKTDTTGLSYLAPLGIAATIMLQSSAQVCSSTGANYRRG